MLKETVDVILSVLPFKEGYARFTTVSFKSLSHKNDDNVFFYNF